MKTLWKALSILSLGIGFFNIAQAQDATYTADTSSSTSSDALVTLTKHLDNLGGYFGFIIANSPPNLQDTQSTYNSSLLNLQQTQTNQTNLISQLFSSTVINSTFNTFFSGSPYQTLNSLSNTAFTQNNFTISKIDYTSGLSSPLNPVNQLLLNILSVTPDEFCYTQQPSNSAFYNWNSNCTFPYTSSFYIAHELGIDIDASYLVPAGTGSTYNGLSTLSNNISASNLYPVNSSGQSSQNPNIGLLNQIDASLLTSPLIYTKDSGSTSQTGLIPSNQLQAAQSVARFLSGTTHPKIMASSSNLAAVMDNIRSATDIKTQLMNFRSFGNYLLDLRTYSARASVALNNIYNILGKRLPSQSDASTASSSQALNEFTMATYRLYTPPNSGDGSSQTTTNWQNMINNASPATVQKETVILLAEINYQLYLMRQQQEQLLLTQSVALMNALTPPSLSTP